jgi:hypothetical protein
VRIAHGLVTTLLASPILVSPILVSPILVSPILVASIASAQQTSAQRAESKTVAPPDGSSSVGWLTIYNQDFAVARTTIDLDLHAGRNEVATDRVTSRLEPDSVVLRDPSGKRLIHVLEQNYDAAVVNQEWLLQKYEGKTIDFQTFTGTDGQRTVQGKIIRAGGRSDGGYNANGQYMGAQQTQPLIEVDGKMRFQLPGTPLFPATTDGLLLKPTLRWQIRSEKAERFGAELAYITGGLDWNATYNVVLPSSVDVTGDEKADLVGWVTIHNQSGTEFPQARIKLMAGDVAKLKAEGFGGGIGANRMMLAAADSIESNRVTQKPFDDFHLYDLNRTVALRDGETKQVQFIDAADVSVHRTYLYDGAAQLQPYYDNGNINQQRGYGLDNGNTKVRIVEGIKNSEANHLGMPMPAGRIRLYRRDADGQMEFIGEDTINHTPAEDTVKLSTGSAFDVKGSRRQTDFHINQQDRIVDESFEIEITNQKAQPVNVNVVERLYRGVNWEIREKSSDFTKRDSRTVEFPIKVPAKGEATLTYSVRYTW